MSSFIDAVEQRFLQLVDSYTGMKSSTFLLRQALTEVLAEAGPVAVVDENDDEKWADILPNVSVKVGTKLFTAPPADALSMEHANLMEQASIEIKTLRTQLAAAQAALANRGSLLREPISATNPLPPGCYCKPGQCAAPVIMGRQMGCRDPAKRDAAIATDQSDAGSEAV